MMEAVVPRISRTPDLRARLIICCGLPTAEVFHDSISLGMVFTLRGLSWPLAAPLGDLVCEATLVGELLL